MNGSVDHVHCLQPLYIMVQVVTITFLTITDNNLILHLEISANIAYAGFEGNNRIAPVFESLYIYHIQPIYIRIHIKAVYADLCNIK